MKVLFLTTNCTGPGGVQYVGRLLLRALSDSTGKNSTVTLLSVKDREQDVMSIAAQCRVFACAGSRFRTVWKGLHVLRRHSCDLLVLAHINLSPLLHSIPRRRRPPTIAFVHGIESWKPIGRLRCRALLSVDRFLFNSRFTAQRAEAANPWLRRLHTSVCPLALMPTEASVPTQSSGEQTSFALTIGRMAASERYKGFEELIRAWPAVQRARTGFSLVLIGDGDDRPRLEAIARDVGANVRFLGIVSDATRDAYLSACRCFCLPSRGEGFGLVYLEAMRVGKPVLSSNCDAGQEVIVDGVTGRAVDPTDHDELVGGILEVSGERADEMGRAGQERFSRMYTYEHFRERFGKHVLEVAAMESLTT